MKRLVGVVTAVAVLGAGVATASAAETISFVSVTKSEKETRTGFTSRDDLLRGGKKVGTDVVTCRFAKNTATCRVLVKLADGTITLGFSPAENSDHGPLKVVGGTGEYAGAKGTGSYRNLNDRGTRTKVTIRLA